MAKQYIRHVIGPGIQKVVCLKFCIRYQHIFMDQQEVFFKCHAMTLSCTMDGCGWMHANFFCEVKVQTCNV